MAEPVDRFDELQLLRVDRTGRVATITIDRAPFNLFDGQMLAELNRVGARACG